jgi:serine/threonine protein kinase
MAVEAGQQLLHYRLIEKIGEGGMDVFWKAEDTKLHRFIALKVLPDPRRWRPIRIGGRASSARRGPSPR